MIPLETVVLWGNDEAKEAIEKCESPIERLMFCSLYQAAAIHTSHLAMIHFGWKSSIQIGEWAIIPQYKIAGCRADFVVRWGGIHRAVVIECDGHDFHERTKQQVIADNQRNRILRNHHFEVIRFSGSEIHNDPMQCAFDVHGLFCTIYDETRKAS